MSTRRADVVIVGGGQAGLALSYFLTAQGRDHVVLEQARIAESWRSRRWDSLRLIAPNWSLELPGFSYSGEDPEAYMGKDDVADNLVAYARSFVAPVEEGVRATAIEHDATHDRFRVLTEGASYDADQVVLATGALQKPRVPAMAADVPATIAQVVPYDYRNPGQLRSGAALIVGSGQTGCQIAEELVRAGRSVYLAMSRCWWLPRSYRARNASAWLRSLGWMKRTANELPPGARAGLNNPQLTGGDGGHDISAHTLAREGVRLLGRLRGIRNGKAFFADDLGGTIAWGDERARAVLRDIDVYIRQHDLDSPMEEWPRDLLADHHRDGEATDELDLAGEGISTVIWATGYRPDLEWVGLPFLDGDRYPMQRRGVTPIPGLYILGLDWLHTAGSGLFNGIGADAAFLSERIASHPDG